MTTDLNTRISGPFQEFPDGTLLGGPGYLAANRVTEDLGMKKWWKPTAEMEKFTKTCLGK